MVGIIVVIATIVCSAVLHFRAMGALKLEVQDKLVRAARVIARDLDAGQHQTFVDRGQETTPEYQRAIEPLRRALYWQQGGQLVRNDYRFIYTCILKNDRVFFVLDPTPPGTVNAKGKEEKSHIMQPYPEASPGLREVLITGVPSADPEPYEDQWGSFVSGYAPFFDAAGKLVGAVGVDWDASTYSRRLAGIRRAWYLQIVLCLLSGFVSGLVTGVALVRRERVEAAQRHAIEEARRSRERWRIMVETLPKPAVHLQDGEFWINAPLVACLGYQSSEIKSPDDWFTRVFRERAADVRAAYETDRAANFRHSREVRAHCRDGSERWLEFTAHRYDPGEVWMLVDITEQKEFQTRIIAAREAAEAAAQAKGAFLATVSHEIRTPMNGVIGMTNLLLETPLEPRQREMTETIRNCGESLVVVINDILDFSKIESGGMELENESVSLRACVEDCLDLFAAKAGEKNVDLVYSMAADCPAAVRGDPTRLRQILCNLIGNAIKFTAKGEIEVQISAEGDGATPDDADFLLRVRVRDTGIGIPADRMDRLFKSFSQVDSSTARKYGGTGLGLAISKRLAELMGGTMGVTSEVGRGSVFFFTMRTRADVAAGRGLVLAAKPSLRGLRTLLVMENQTTSLVLQGYFQQWGLLCLAVPDGVQALRLLREGGPYDLLVTGLQLPEIDGFALCRRLHELPGAHPKIIMISTVTRPDIRAEARAQGIGALLQKPIRPGNLLQAIEETLAGSPRPIATVAPFAATSVNLASQMPFRILVADDNQVNQLVAKRILERFGYAADFVSNGIEALAAVERQAYDVVFMDVQMPEMNGHEATERIRATLPADRQPWVIALTAGTLEGDREICLQHGMNDFLSKPIRFSDLEQSLKRVPPRR